MAQCTVCSSPNVKEINKRILTGRQIAETAREFGFTRGILYWHIRHHLPFRSSRAKPPETTEGKLKALEYEFARLRALAEAGEKVSEQLRVLVAERSLLELMLRKEGALDATHRPLLPQPLEGEFEVVFQAGRPVTRPVKKAVNE